MSGCAVSPVVWCGGVDDMECEERRSGKCNLYTTRMCSGLYMLLTMLWALPLLAVCRYMKCGSDPEFASVGGIAR